MVNKKAKKTLLRSPRMAEKYEKYIKEKKPSSDFLLTNPAIKEWKYWRLIKNDFPYDKLTRKHHLLVPKRILTHDMDINIDEQKELGKIKKELNNEYDSIMEHFMHKRSLKHHYHLHFISYKHKAI